MNNPELIPVMGMITGIIINLGLFTAIILAIYYNVRARNRERMALIEKGADLSEIYKKKEKSGNGFFKFGVVVIGIAVGLLFGVLLSKVDLFPPVVAYFAMILLFGGAGVLLGNQLAMKNKARQ